MKKNVPNKNSRRALSASIKDAVHVDASITIAAPIERVYEFCQNIDNLPKFFPQLASVEAGKGRASTWTWKTLDGNEPIRWKSEAIHNEKPKYFAWNSLEGSELAHAGELVLEYLPEKFETELRVHLDYAPPGGKVTDFIAKVFGKDANSLVKEELRRLRQLVEVGYLATIEGQPKGNSESGSNANKKAQK